LGSSSVNGDDAGSGGGCGDDGVVRVGKRGFEEGDVAVTVNDAAPADEPAGEGWPKEARVEVQGGDELPRLERGEQRRSHTIEVGFAATEDFTTLLGEVLGGFLAAMLYDTVPFSTSAAMS
jgi:hypothetical protein